MSFQCSVCGFSLWIPVGRYGVTHVGLYDDVRYPGRCIVALTEHHEHFEQLEASVASKFIRDVQVAGSVIRRVSQAPRMNYAILGNVEPHIHAHVIPRQVGSDPEPQRSPWQNPIPHTKMTDSERDAIVASLTAALSAISG